MERVRVILGDTDNTPYGGGTWASRGAALVARLRCKPRKSYAGIF